MIEFVFSLPESFEGGAIDGVQRVSMKRTEQDRGDPLIAVPAKITDDFHMIALNDFAEAVSNNTELLRSRSWIDIPITYRNGRRALLTLEKGQGGADPSTRPCRHGAVPAAQLPAGSRALPGKVGNGFRPVVRGFRAHEDMKKSRLGVQPGFSFVEK